MSVFRRKPPVTISPSDLARAEQMAADLTTAANELRVALTVMQQIQMPPNEQRHANGGAG